MPTPPPKPPDRHYDFGSMNLWFAVSAVALLAITVLMVFFDYRQPWKRLQAEFRDRERQKLAREAETERQRINERELAQLQQELDAEEGRLREQRRELDDLEKRLAGFAAKVYEADAASRQTKSLLDTARFQYEEALQSGRGPAERKGEVDRLSAELRERRKALELYSAERDAVRGELDERRAGRAAGEEKIAALRKGVTALEQRVALLGKNIDYYLLNAPLMDFLQPTLKVEQVILPGLYHDINFTRIDRVDRCMTCHVAANRAGFEGEEFPQPLRSHPRLELFVGDASPHPYGRFGCTICHGGLDRATDFARAGHSPRSEEQRAEWVAKWGWERQPFLETPIVPAGLSESGCVTCHAQEVWTPESQVQETGRELISHFGCYGCHLIDYPAFTGLRRAGPSLLAIAGKTRPGWAYKWIEAPREFHPTTWMPHFFFLENVVGQANLERQRAEIRAAVAYLWARSETPVYPPAPPGDAARGKQVFETVGCTGCHVLDADARRDQFFPQINRLHGPNLVRTGSKVASGWLYAWVKDPKQYFPDTNMPDLRLTDAEAADVVAYLMASRDPAWENLAVPAVDGEVRAGLVLGYLQQTHTIEQSQAELERMDDGARDVYLGQQTVAKYGCYGCHDIRGFEGAKPIGTELTEEGSKSVHQFDFGHVHDVPHTRHDWIRTKLLRPRVWDHGKEEVKDYHELYKMPDFGMSAREADAVLANVLGFTEESVLASRRAGAQEPRTAALAEGRRLMTRYNCQGCHLIEGHGQAIRSAISDPGLLPPNLAAEGARVQSDWLFDFLHDPGRVRLRPWLSVRMPTFAFSDQQANTLVGYFAAHDRAEPFASPAPAGDPQSVAAGGVVFSMLQCAKCHPAGPQAEAGASTAELAPSLLLARSRLRHGWVPSWILDPQSWVPGTRMPANFQRLPSGEYQGPPFAQALQAPMFSTQRAALLRQFGSEEAMIAFLGDPEKVTTALRDYVWTLDRAEGGRAAAAP